MHFFFFHKQNKKETDPNKGKIPILNYSFFIINLRVFNILSENYFKKRKKKKKFA